MTLPNENEHFLFTAIVKTLGVVTEYNVGIAALLSKEFRCALFFVGKGVIE